MADREDDEAQRPSDAQDHDKTPRHPDQRKAEELLDAHERNRRQKQVFEQRLEDAAADDTRRQPLEPLTAEQEERLLNPYLATLAEKYPERGHEPSRAEQATQSE